MKILLLVVAGIVSIIAVVSALFVADQWKQADEYNQWLTLTEDTESVMESFNLAMDGYWNENVETKIQKKSAWAKTGKLFYQGAVDLSLLVEDMNDVGLLPWHSNLEQARQDYIAHTEAWITFYEKEYEFSQSVQGLESWSYSRDTIDISTTFAIAERSAKKALPIIFAGDLEQRVQSEFLD